MPSVDSILQVELKAILDLLNQQLQQLSDQLMAQQHWPVYVQGVDFTHAKTNLCTHIRQLEYDNDAMKPGETVSYQGICGTTAESLALIQATNETRGQLSMLLRKMDKIIVQSEQGRLRLSVHALNALGYARFNRKQTIRKLYTFDDRLNTVSYFWASQRKITKASVAEVRADIDRKLENATADFRYYLTADRAHLSNVPANEVLYYVYQKNDNPRANYVLDTADGPKRGSCLASSPFFYPASENSALPRIRDLPDLQQRAPRLSRTDKVINDTPFLPSVHVHRLAP